jgi:serine/threonine protein kinase
MDLRTLLLRQNEAPLSLEEVSWLKNAFGCIATALAYLHDEVKIRHKDIKPGNILLNDGSVFLCDFGIAHDWSAAESSTTTGPPDKFTWKYSAPEVVAQRSRNDSSDIWSLGCVYLEMITVIKGHTIAEMESFIQETTTFQGGYWSARDRVYGWLEKLRTEPADDAPLRWIEQMVRYICAS